MARVSFRLALACFVGTVGAYSSSASAACPGSFVLSPTLGICTTSDGGYTVNCDVGKFGDSMDSVGWFVETSSTTFIAYGFDANGDDYCDQITVQDGCAGNPITLSITGGGQSDEINLVDTVSGYDMDCSNSTVHAQDGDDYIKGSPNATYQHDYLYGDENDDAIWGYEGNDYLNGGYGSDHIKAGAGADTIYGENGNDYLCGEADGDTLYGGDGDDRVFGGTGVDYNNGDGGVNVCENENMSLCTYTTSSCGW